MLQIRNLNNNNIFKYTIQTEIQHFKAAMSSQHAESRQGSLSENYKIYRTTDVTFADIQDNYYFTIRVLYYLTL